MTTRTTLWKRGDEQRTDFRFLTTTVGFSFEVISIIFSEITNNTHTVRGNVVSSSSLRPFSFTNISFTWLVASCKRSVDVLMLASRKLSNRLLMSSCICLRFNFSNTCGITCKPPSNTFSKHHMHRKHRRMVRADCSSNLACCFSFLESFRCNGASSSVDGTVSVVATTSLAISSISYRMPEHLLHSVLFFAESTHMSLDEAMRTFVTTLNHRPTFISFRRQGTCVALDFLR